MDKTCRNQWKLGLPCYSGPLPPLADEEAEPVHAPVSKAPPAGIVFNSELSKGVVPSPGYNALAPLNRPVRDPALSLVALGGIDPTGPVMVEVPLVLNNTTFTASRELGGWRLGFAHRYVRGDHAETVEHSAALRTAFDLLRQAGAQLIPVDARCENDTFQFTLQSNEIDDLVSEHRLDALISDSQSVAFHRACTNGYPSLYEPLGEGAKLWFYGARWSRDALPILLRAYRQLSAGVPGGSRTR